MSIACIAVVTRGRSRGHAQRLAAHGTARWRLSPTLQYRVATAYATAGRATGFSTIGMWTIAAKTPSATDSHQTTSYEPVRS